MQGDPTVRSPLKNGEGSLVDRAHRPSREAALTEAVVASLRYRMATKGIMISHWAALRININVSNDFTEVCRSLSLNYANRAFGKTSHLSDTGSGSS